MLAVRHTLPHARTCEQAVLLLAMPTVAVVSVLVTRHTACMQ